MSEIKNIEQWLEVLMQTYSVHPSKGLAKIIYYYLSKLLSHDEVKNCHSKLCEYLSIKRYWCYQAHH